MKQPDGFDEYEGGSPYWILPSGQKTYDNEYWKSPDGQNDDVRARRIDFIPNYQYYDL